MASAKKDVKATTAKKKKKPDHECEEPWCNGYDRRSELSFDFNVDCTGLIPFQVRVLKEFLSAFGGVVKQT